MYGQSGTHEEANCAAHNAQHYIKFKNHKDILIAIDIVL